MFSDLLTKLLVEGHGVIIDTMHKVKSRKFQVWVLATIAFFMGLLPADAWMIVSMLYMGIQGAIDYAKSKAPEFSKTADQ